MDILTPNCWVRDPNTQVFEVKISKPETVGALKKAIKDKEPTTFLDVDAENLSLYKPKNPVTEEDLNGFILSEHAERLMGLHELSEVFPKPPSKRHIHIIVDTPYPRISYWLRGAEIDHECSLRIRSSEAIWAFRELLLQHHADLGGVPKTCINLYRILDGNIEEYLLNTNDGKFLSGRQMVSHCFADIPILQTYCIVVQISDVNRNDTESPTPASNQMITGEDLTDEGDPIKLARNGFLAGRPPKAPSDAPHPSSFRGSQRHPMTQIRCGRPRDPEETIPATLLHPVFGQFLNDCKTHSPTAEDNTFIGKFANAMSEVYDTEKERVDKVNAVLASYGIGLCVTTKKGTPDSQVGGDLSVGEYHYVLAEFKNEVAASASEPYVQAALYYLERTRTPALENTGSPLPCFLLALFGSYIVFAGAVWNLRPAVQILSTPLALNYHSTDTDNQITVVRHTAAFRNAVRTLRQYYEVLSVEGLSNTLSHPSLFPYPTSYTSLADNSKKTFPYRERVKDDYKLVFFGTLVEDMGFAPTLRGFEQIPGGWFMVVMDKLVGYKSLDTLTNRLPKSVFDDIRNQLDRLHDDGFVHGDVRDVNIVVKGIGTASQLVIIDFDWAGEISVACYPPFVSRNGIDWPDGATDGKPILAAHDH